MGNGTGTGACLVANDRGKIKDMLKVSPSLICALTTWTRVSHDLTWKGGSQLQGNEESQFLVEICMA